MIKKIFKKITKLPVKVYNKFTTNNFKKPVGVKILNDEYFLLEDKIYLASADQFEGLKGIVEGPNVMQCKNFYSVIGGLGGLNILARLEQLDSIVFFDLNPYMAKICELIFEVIKNCETRDEFISLIYLRDFSSKKYFVTNQHEYYSKPVDQALLNKLKSKIKKDLFDLYMKAYYPYILDPMVQKYDGISLHCTTLRVFHEAPRNGVMTYPFLTREEMAANKMVSVNSFFFGKGWLKNEERFIKVKNHLKNKNLSIITRSIYELEFKPFSGLYASNVFNGDEKGYPETVYKFEWMLMYGKKSNYLELEYKLPGSRLIKISKVYGEGESDTHKSCCELLNDHFDLENERFLEVIYPHVSEGMVFGFRFYKGYTPINVEEFVNLKTPGGKMPKIIGIHMLMGNHCDTAIWKKAVLKAFEFGEKIFIFEHRRNCTDWPEWDVEADWIMPEIEIDRFLLELSDGWKKYGAANKYGEADDIRNICWIIKKRSEAASDK